MSFDVLQEKIIAKKNPSIIFKSEWVIANQNSLSPKNLSSVFPTITGFGSKIA